MQFFKLTFCLSAVLIFSSASAQLTVFEKSNGTETATYAETIKFYKALDQASPVISMREAGETDANFPLHLVLVSSSGVFDPVRIHAENKVIILINNGIHPGEPDGIDASMMLLRDIKDRKIILPANIVLAVIPVYNIGGALNRNSYTRVNQNGPKEYGFRGNSQNLDLNRDFTKNDSREAKAFAQLFHYLNADVFIDTHVSDGADFQHTMTLITTQYDKLGPVAGPWLRDVFEPALYAGMKKRSWNMIPYVEFDGADFNRGIDMFYETPRYSSGYAALFGCFAFISETHMLKPYAGRVRSTYDLLKTLMETSSAHAAAILETRQTAAARQKTQMSFPLRWQIDRDRSTFINFMGYSQDSALSAATGLQKMFYNRTKPFEKQVKYYNRYAPALSVDKPKAYILKAGYAGVEERLRLNGVKFRRLISDTSVNVTVTKIDSYQSRTPAYEKHHLNYSVKTSSQKELIRFNAGDVYISTDQPSVRYLIEMLEPTGGDSFFAWNFFDGILQQKEGYSDYRWEELAAEALAKDSILQTKLAAAKAADPGFAKNSRAILDFIYRESGRREKDYMRYPVYRIEL